MIKLVFIIIVIVLLLSFVGSGFGDITGMFGTFGEYVLTPLQSFIQILQTVLAPFTTNFYTSIVLFSLVVSAVIGYIIKWFTGD